MPAHNHRAARMTEPASPALRRVARGKLCAGCGACAALAPGAVEMRSSGGFLRPVQLAEVAPEAEARIAAACPGLGQALDPAGRPDHPLWGPWHDIRTGHATDPALRRNASSGGALSALLVHLLETGAVDRVLQVSADPALPLGNAIVSSPDAAAVFAAAGSRYAPSAPLAGLAALLAGGMRFAFVGKPCDVSALRAMARDDPRVDARFPVMLSFFCAGVPGLDGAREVVAKMGLPEQDVTAFRYRGDGWPGFATATTADGRSARMSYADSWGGILSRHVQPRCRICPDGTGSFADLVCADAWDADARGYPRFTEGDGRSLILARTEKGRALLAAAEAAGRVETTAFDIAALAPIQPGQTGKRRLTLARMAGLRLLFRPVPRYRGFHLLRNAARAGIAANLRNMLGTVRRGLRGRI